MFRALRQASATGRLRVLAPERRTLYFEAGNPVYAVSSALPERLGEFLIRAGKLTPDSLREALALTSLDKKLGTVLVEHRAISPSELVWAIRELVKEIILAVFALESGRYRFEPCDLSGEDIVKLPFKTDTLLGESGAASGRPKAVPSAARSLAAS